MKLSYVLVFFLALSGGILGATLPLSFSNGELTFLQRASLYFEEKEDTKKLPEPAVEQTQVPDVWQSAVLESSDSVVAVQTFQDAQMIRSGSGLVVSADGLVLTVADLVPVGQFAYQVVYNDRIMRGVVVNRDYLNNLALIKVEGSDFNIANLATTTNIQPGKDLVIVGRITEVGQASLFAQKAMVYTSSSKTVVLDTVSRLTLSGAQVVDVDKKVIGVVSLRSGKVLLTSVSRISEFLTTYLSSISE